MPLGRHCSVITSNNFPPLLRSRRYYYPMQFANGGHHGSRVPTRVFQKYRSISESCGRRELKREEWLSLLSLFVELYIFDVKC